ncbi:MAG: hypothetical protein K6G52_01775 [Treponemataceae bacterium]|nr:hypothetical protein [Treponemataceae bacterium]
MKKILAVLLAGVVLAVGVFAVDMGSFPTGTWQDSRWNADWVFSVEGVQLKDSNSGALIFDFANKMENFAVTPSVSGVSLSFDCAETGRSYTFTKGMSATTDIEMEIRRTGLENYKVTLPMK